MTRVSSPTATSGAKSWPLNSALVDVELDDAHWAPLRFMRQDSARTGVTPTLRRLQTVGGFDVKELYRLYPGKPVKMMAWLAGLPKPVGCV